MSRRYTTYSLTVPANASQTIDVHGSFFSVVSANHNAFEIGLDDDVPGFAAPGLGYQAQAEDQRFSRLRVVNTNDSALLVALQVGSGRFVDNRLSLTGAVSVTKAAGLRTVDDKTISATTAAQILPVDLTRREALVTNLSQAVTLRVGDSAVADNRGTPLAPEATIVVTSSAAIWIRNPAAGSAKVAICEITD